MFPLPAIRSHESGTQHANVASKEFRCPLLKLPSWDQPAVINWEPLEPPSPYNPVLQRRQYPLVMSSFFSRVACSDVEKEGKILTTNNKVRTLKKHCEMTIEEEEAILLVITREESIERDKLIFLEQREWTHLWVDYLQHFSLCFDGDIELMEEEARNACEREESRRRMCYAIEMQSSAWLIQRRLKDFVFKKTSELLPMYKDGRETIMSEEEKELTPLLGWFKNKRPFGMPLPPYFGNNKTSIKPTKPVGERKSVRSTYREKRAIPSTNVRSNFGVSLDSWPESFPEKSYKEDGRIAWKHYKASLCVREDAIVFLKKKNENMWEKGYNDIIAEEAEMWLCLMALSAESYHDVKWREKEREKKELEKELEWLEELKKREVIFANLESKASPIWDEVIAVEILRQREYLFRKMEHMASINEEAERLEYLHKRGVALKELETKASIEREIKLLQDLRRREEALAKREDGKDDALVNTNYEAPAAVVHNSESVVTDACSTEQLLHAYQSSGREEGSSSCESDLQSALLHPKLNVVLAVAIERDPFLALQNPTLSALGDAERILAACEGCSSGRAAHVLAFASRMPFCPAYLVHVLWCPHHSLTESGPAPTAVVDDECAAVVKLVELEVEERRKLLVEQIISVWELYQKAAIDASNISNTRNGEVYYVGVCMSSEF